MSLLITCECGHDLRAHYSTADGDRLPQPCAKCDCDDFIEREAD